MNNRNTTVAGVASICIAVCGVLLALFDGDAGTNPDFASAAAGIMAGIGLILAKDAKGNA